MRALIVSSALPLAACGAGEGAEPATSAQPTDQAVKAFAERPVDFGTPGDDRDGRPLEQRPIDCGKGKEC
jgi:hypothetical protein